MVLILYADDILLLIMSVVHIERLLHHCEEELAWLDIMKSCCLRVGCGHVLPSAVLMADLYHGRVFYKLKDLKMFTRFSQAGVLQSGKQHLW